MALTHLPCPVPTPGLDLPEPCLPGPPAPAASILPPRPWGTPGAAGAAGTGASPPAWDTKEGAFCLLCFRQQNVPLFINKNGGGGVPTRTPGARGRAGGVTLAQEGAARAAAQ